MIKLPAKFFLTQIKPLKKENWGKTVIEDLQHLEINLSFKEIGELPIQTYRKIIKIKIKWTSLEYLLNKRNKRNGKKNGTILPKTNDAKLFVFWRNGYF